MPFKGNKNKNIMYKNGQEISRYHHRNNVVRWKNIIVWLVKAETSRRLPTNSDNAIKIIEYYKHLDTTIYAWYKISFNRSIILNEICENTV